MTHREMKRLTELELAVIRVVWKHGETTVEQIRRDLEASGRKLAQPSIRTMLSILREKGYVKRHREGRGYTYAAAISAEQARQSILADMIERAFEGSALEMMAAVVKSKLVSDKELDAVKQLIRDHEKEAGK